ncbi:MAG: hypothetical protein K6F48_03115, partial [Paludibacteraceae bacterium]|nr:hypothetical protein [Paludibacteraceae bacterium]
PDNWSRKRYQVIRSVYDEPIYGESTNNEIYQAFGEGGQQHLRNRIATTLYQEVYDASPTHYNHATHYSYDIHGNVSTLVHDIYGLRNIGQRFKRIDYDYDLVSGKVNRLDYQKDKADGYSLRYEYDAENRLTRVLANYQGDDAWNELAHYEYYRHGPLARTVLGENLQGVDYAYTLQGWTKGVNLDAESNAGVKADVYGYELQYNNEDYKPISGTNYRTVDGGAVNLYNGNIVAMQTNLTQNVSAPGNFGAQTRRFVYDELNRLKASQVLGSDQYQTSYIYDANGNITNLTRNDHTGAAMDNLTYHYAKDAKGNILSNRLLHVNDAVRNNATTTDIKDQNQNDVSYEQQKPSTHNYDYDEIGNLIKDKSEDIAEIKWTMTGKVSDVTRTAGSQKPDLHFDYDAKGQRIAKTVTNKNVTMGDKFVTTYYVRDPQGNVLAVYEHKHGDSDNGTFTLTEQHLYGAGRLGMRKRDLALNTGNANESPANYYELTNHLGNVMAVISDEATTTDKPTIVSMTDYYPFGMTEPGRSYDAYRYGFNSQENVPELGEGHTTALYWEYDGRLGRRWNLDPITKEYESSYSVLGNSPIYAIDIAGADSTLFGENGEILCKISNDNGETSVYFALRTAQSTEEMYGEWNYNNNDHRGWTNPITPDEQRSAKFSAIDYNISKALGITGEQLVEYERNIEWQSFVQIPSPQDGDVSLNFLYHMDWAFSLFMGTEGNREYGWNINSWSHEIYSILIGDYVDPSNSDAASLGGMRSHHAHPYPNESWAQPPSADDINNMAQYQDSDYRFVWGMGNQRLYIFNRTGVIATVPFSVYCKSEE